MNNRYKRIYEKQAKFYQNHPSLIKWLGFFNLFLPILVALVYFFLIGKFLIFTKERQNIDFWRLLFCPAACFLVSSLLRIIINHKRPYEEGIIPLLKKVTVGKSFPSRHLCCAFVIGTISLYYSLPLGICVLITGCIIGYIRFTAGIHYPIDLLFGAILGILFALPIYFFG